jgi:pimeloyl-ACP methyl ester carboxylesterase
MKMKKFAIAVVTLFLHFALNAQTVTYPFDVKISGKGKQAIVFIPGFSCSGDVWNDTKILFEKQFTCYTLTMAGFAGAVPQAEISFAYWEKNIADYIQQNKINKPIIIGHSMGGGLAMALAADYPLLIDRIVVVDALPCLAAMMNPSFVAKPNNDCSPLVAQFSALSDSQFYQMQKKNMASLVADTSKQELVVSWSVKSDRKTFATIYCDFSNTDLREKIANVQCPSLILLESYFINFKPSMTEQFKKMKTANLQYATKGLHFIMFDDFIWYQQQIQQFIQPANKK